MNPVLKDYAKTSFPDSKSDLLTMFMERGSMEPHLEKCFP
jgi:hypothetical protein